MPIDHGEFTTVKELDKTSTRSDEGPEESITFVYWKMETIDNLVVDPNNPNTPRGIQDGTSASFSFGERYESPDPIGGVSVACGDVNALGDPITFTATIGVDSPS